MWDLVSKTKSKFMDSIKSAEVGELILYVLLEASGIVQLIQKMRLKTSKRISVFGFDAIHIGVDEDITLYYGDSKMYKIFNDGLNRAIKKFKRNYFLYMN